MVFYSPKKNIAKSPYYKPYKCQNINICQFKNKKKKENHAKTNIVWYSNKLPKK